MLWRDIIYYKRKFEGGDWCLGGDFNAISNKKEMFGSSSSHCSQSEIEELNEFINPIELVDIPTISNFFTWSNRDGSSRSRLDKFLLSKSLVDG